MDTVPDVPGLYIQENAVSPSYEEAMIQWLDNQSWSTTLSRRTQQYGYTYDYSSRIIKKAPNPLSGLVLEFANRLQTAGLMTPDQCIVNEYTFNQGIGAHTDLAGFGPTIISLSLESPTNFVFQNPYTGKKVGLEVPARTLLVMTGEARKDWTHEIPRRKTYTVDGKMIYKSSDYRRISVTYRTVPPMFVQPN